MMTPFSLFAIMNELLPSRAAGQQVAQRRRLDLHRLGGEPPVPERWQRADPLAAQPLGRQHLQPAQLQLPRRDIRSPMVVLACAALRAFTRLLEAASSSSVCTTDRSFDAAAVKGFSISLQLFAHKLEGQLSLEPLMTLRQS